MALQNFVSRSLPVISAAWLNAVDVAKSIFAIATGPANAYVVAAPVGAGISLTTGTVVRFSTTNPNTGASTLNVGGLGVVAIVSQQGLSLTGGEIQSGITWVQYTGTAWQIIGTGAIPGNQRTAAEIAASVTPVNYTYTSGNLLRYGTNTVPGTTDMTTALQTCVNVCARSGDTCFIPAGTYKITSDITIPVGVVFLNAGPSFAFDIRGAGREQTVLQFATGGTFAKGLYWNGVSGFKLCGKISDIRIDGGLLTTDALTFLSCDMPKVERCIIRNTVGRAIFFDTCIMPQMESTYIAGNGSPSFGQVEVLSCTLFCWNVCYISGCVAGCIGGVLVDKSQTTSFFGGAIESTGCMIKVGSKSDAAAGCIGGVIYGMDWENPVDDHYIEFGYGQTSTAFCAAWDVRGVNGFPSGTATVRYGVKINGAQCPGLTFGENNWALAGTPTATHQIDGTTNGVVIDPHPALFSSSPPWVIMNGVQVTWATPRTQFLSADTIGWNAYPATGTISTATASLLVQAQGGIYRKLLVSNGGAVTMTALTGGVRGMRITMISVNANTTLTHSAAAANQWNLTLSGAANLLMVANKPYDFEHNGINWYQVTN